MMKFRLEAIEDGIVVGEATFEEDQSFLPKREMRALHLSWLGVVEGFRHRGVATRLFGAVRAFAFGMNYDFVFGWHAGANEPIKSCLLKNRWLLPDEGDLANGKLPERWPFIHILPLSPRGYHIPEAVLDQLQSRASERNRLGL